MSEITYEKHIRDTIAAALVEGEFTVTQRHPWQSQTFPTGPAVVIDVPVAGTPEFIGSTHWQQEFRVRLTFYAARSNDAPEPCRLLRQQVQAYLDGVKNLNLGTIAQLDKNWTWQPEETEFTPTGFNVVGCRTVLVLAPIYPRGTVYSTS